MSRHLCRLGARPRSGRTHEKPKPLADLRRFFVTTRWRPSCFVSGDQPASQFIPKFAEWRAVDGSEFDARLAVLVFLVAVTCLGGAQLLADGNVRWFLFSLVGN